MYYFVTSEYLGNMQLPNILCSLALVATAFAKPTVYLIRHGEKPPSGNGLSVQGEQRAQCLRTVFGATSQYQIGHIMAQTPKSSMDPCALTTSRFLG